MTAPGDEKTDVWAKLAAPLPPSSISWRQDGKATARDGKFFARFVCYVEAGTVRERLDSTCPGEWDLTLEPLLPRDIMEDGGAVRETEYGFKARLQVLGVIREDVGTGCDYKSASTDAFKRAAVRFGIGHELYAFEQNWVQVDSDRKYAKPVEDPQTAYSRRYGNGANKGDVAAIAAASPQAGAGQPTPASPVAPKSTLTDTETVTCPKCDGRMWDNRIGKRNPKAPDYRCQNKSCDGVIWPPKENDPIRPIGSGKANTESPDSYPRALVTADDDLPF